MDMEVKSFEDRGKSIWYESWPWLIIWGSCFFDYMDFKQGRERSRGGENLEER